VEEVWHYAVQPGGKGRVACIGSGCPLCELRHELDEKAFSRIRAKKSYLFNAVVRDGNGGQDTNVICQVGPSVYNKLVAYITGSDLNNALDAKKGRDFYITRTGEGMGTRYDVMPTSSPCAVGHKFDPVDLLASQKDAPSKGELKKLADDFGG
jgi:hypothetical protein